MEVKNHPPIKTPCYFWGHHHFSIQKISAKPASFVRNPPVESSRVKCTTPRSAGGDGCCSRAKTPKPKDQNGRKRRPKRPFVKSRPKMAGSFCEVCFGTSCFRIDSLYISDGQKKLICARIVGKDDMFQVSWGKR